MMGAPRNGKKAWTQSDLANLTSVVSQMKEEQAKGARGTVDWGAVAAMIGTGVTGPACYGQWYRMKRLREVGREAKRRKRTAKHKPLQPPEEVEEEGDGYDGHAVVNLDEELIMPIWELADIVAARVAKEITKTTKLKDIEELVKVAVIEAAGNLSNLLQKRGELRTKAKAT